MDWVPYFALVCALLAVVYGIVTSRQVLSADAGNEKMQEIAAAIQEGARAYLNRQYMTIAVAGVGIAIIVGLLLGVWVAVGFVIGAILSAAAGYIGMNVSVRANVRTAEAARQGLAQGLRIAFQAGAVTGMLVAGLALLAVAGYLLILNALGMDQRGMIDALVALGFGASLISIFARLGGGIFTKGADVGAEPGGQGGSRHPGRRPAQPGRDRRQCRRQCRRLRGHGGRPVRDLRRDHRRHHGAGADFRDAGGLIYPLAIGGVCIITSIIGTYFVRLGTSNNIMGALYKGFIAAAVLSLGGIAVVTELVVGFGKAYNAGGTAFTGMDLFLCAVIGLIVTGLIIWVTEYYTGTNCRPVRSIAKSSETGHGTNVIQGLAISMEATALPAIIICVAILSTFLLAGCSASPSQ